MHPNQPVSPAALRMATVPIGSFAGRDFPVARAVDAPAPRAFQDLGPFILSDCALNLKQELVIG